MVTSSQRVVELESGLPIKHAIEQALENRRGQKAFAQLAAADLKISDPTLYGWAKTLNIDIEGFRYVCATEPAPAAK